MASCRIFALRSLRNAETSLAGIRAACTAASWRASNSDWVTISPLTLTITRSTTSARASTARKARLGRRRGPNRCRFIVHLGTGHQARDEFALAALRLLAGQLGANAPAAVLEGELPAGL